MKQAQAAGRNSETLPIAEKLAELRGVMTADELA
jgi:hypothetical protein